MNSIVNTSCQKENVISATVFKFRLDECVHPCSWFTDCQSSQMGRLTFKQESQMAYGTADEALSLF